MDYPEFQLLINTMEENNYDYKKEVEGIKQNVTKRDTQGLSLSDHVKAMVYAQLSNNRPWGRINDNVGKINKIFFNFDTDALKGASSDQLVESITKIRCGNRQIKHQMYFLKQNIETLERIQSTENGIDNYYKSLPVKKLVTTLSRSESKYKLKYMGVSLVCEYLKGVGIEVVKPDVHIRRLIGRLGYSKKQPATVWETIDICKKIAEKYNKPQYFVDSILWQYCAENKFELCTEQPKCERCLVKNCKGRKN